MKTVIAIDTSTLIASVAVARGTAGSADILAGDDSRVRGHSERLLCLVDEALAAASVSLDQVHGVAVGAGPGSFTGLRIGMATAKGLAFATGKPLWAVSSLAALALALDAVRQVDERTLVVPALDARRSEIFAGFYRLRGGTAEAVAHERVMAPGALAVAVKEVLAASACERAVALGDGFATYGSELEQALQGVAEIAAGAAMTPPASAVARLVLAGEHPDVLVAGAPAYIRLSEAEIRFPHGNPGGSFVV